MKNIVLGNENKKEMFHNMNLFIIYLLDHLFNHFRLKPIQEYTYSVSFLNSLTNNSSKTINKEMKLIYVLEFFNKKTIYEFINKNFYSIFPTPKTSSARNNKFLRTNLIFFKNCIKNMFEKKKSIHEKIEEIKNNKPLKVSFINILNNQKIIDLFDNYYEKFIDQIINRIENFLNSCQNKSFSKDKQKKQNIFYIAYCFKYVNNFTKVKNLWTKIEFQDAVETILEEIQ